MSEFLRQPLAEIRRVQDALVARQVALCAQGHPYYRRRWAQAGIDPANIRNIDDLEALPLTPKKDLMAEPEAFRLHCPDLPLHERALWEVNYTTGSTGEPTPIYVTTHDYQAYLLQARRVAEISGIGDRDILANLFPLTQTAMGAFSRSAANAYASGAAVVGALTGAPHGDFGVHRSLDEAVRMVERHRATVLWGVTSFVRRAIIRAAELGADFKSVRMCGVTGEASSPAMREDMRARLRAMGATNPVIFDRYGSTESGGLAQCHQDGDWHNPAPEVIFHEVVDPDSGRRLPAWSLPALRAHRRPGGAADRAHQGPAQGQGHADQPHRAVGGGARGAGGGRIPGGAGTRRCRRPVLDGRDDRARGQPARRPRGIDPGGDRGGAGRGAGAPARRDRRCRRHLRPRARRQGHPPGRSSMRFAVTDEQELLGL